VSPQEENYLFYRNRGRSVEKNTAVQSTDTTHTHNITAQSP